MFLEITEFSVIVYVSAYALSDVTQETTRPDFVINVVEKPNADVTVIVLTMSEAAQYSDDCVITRNVAEAVGSSTR